MVFLLKITKSLAELLRGIPIYFGFSAVHFSFFWLSPTNSKSGSFHLNISSYFIPKIGIFVPILGTTKFYSLI